MITLFEPQLCYPFLFSSTILVPAFIIVLKPLLLNTEPVFTLEVCLNKSGLSGSGHFLAMVLAVALLNESERSFGGRVLLLYRSKNKIKCLKGQRVAQQRHATYSSHTVIDPTL